MEDMIGTIVLFAGNFLPKGYMDCDGTFLNTAANAPLYSIIGTTYGGNGSTSFALPDLRGRVALGIGKGNNLNSYNLGQIGGYESNNLQINNLPSHSHEASLKVSSNNAKVSIPPNGGSIAAPGANNGREFTATFGFNTELPLTSLNDNSIQVGNTGSGQPVNNLQPYLGIRYVICVEGQYPPKN